MADKQLDRSQYGEQTGAQVESAVSTYYFGDTGVLAVSRPASYATYRQIRRDPIIGLARSTLISAILTGTWSIEPEGDDVSDEWIEFAKAQFMGRREEIVEQALQGMLDYGWQGWEKVFELDGPRVILDKLKPLLHDLTTILVEQKTGAFAGFQQERDSVTLPADKCQLVTHGLEGTNWYGEAQLETVRTAWNRWSEADKGASRYDQKVAGSHLHVQYPPGTSYYNGVETSNSEIADAIVKAFQSSGAIKTPAVCTDEGGAPIDWKRWTITLLSDSSARQYSFVNRLKYLDSLKVAGMLFPPRAILEGEFGTKAEAGEHAKWALVNLMRLDQRIARYVSQYGVSKLLVLNFGEAARDKVKLVAAPLADEALSYLRGLYQAIITNPSGFLEEYGRMDSDALRERIQVPSRPEDEIEEKEAEKDEAVLPAPENPLPGMEQGKPSQFEGALTGVLVSTSTSGDGRFKR